MPKKLTIYLETSVPNAILHGPEYRKEITARFWKEIIPECEIFISRIVIEEIEATQQKELRDKLLELVKEFCILEVSHEAEILSEQYINTLGIPEADALHIAIATIESINYLVSWNMRHIAKEKTRKAVDSINFSAKMPGLYIITPEDLI